MCKRKLYRLGAVCLLILAAATVHAQGGPSTKPYSQAPRISFPVLADPTTLAIALKMDRDLVCSGSDLVDKLERYKKYDFDASVNGLYPMRYHPEGIIEADLGVNLNWLTWLRKKGGPTVEFEGDSTKRGVREPYLGSISVEFAGEASQITDTEKWTLYNYNLAVSARAQIPGTRLSPFGWLPGRTKDEPHGTCPLELRISLKAVAQQAGDDSTFARYDVIANWGLYLTKGAYFYPYFIVSQQEGGKANTYFRAEILRYFGGTISGATFKPFALLRYVNGRQPPAFKHVSELYIGLGADLPL